MLAPLLLLTSIGPPGLDDLTTLRADHGAALVALSDECVERQLLNDAERLLLLARDWSVDDEVLRERSTQLRTVRVRKVQEEREEYRAFLASRDCERARVWLERAEEELQETTTDALCKLARRLLREEESQQAEEALALAFGLDPESRDLHRAAGRERLAELRRRRLEEHSLAGLSLGATIVGPQVTVADFEGKVVLWRSASL